MGRNLSFEKLLKLLQLFLANVGNSPIVKLRIKPMQKVITLARDRLQGEGSLLIPGRTRGSVCACPSRPDKQVNEMFAPSVNQRRHWSVIQIIQAAANQRKSLTGKIDHRRGKIEFGVQPGLYRMLIRRS